MFVRVRNPGAQGKNRELGLQKNSVRNFIGRRAVGSHLKSHAKAWFFVPCVRQIFLVLLNIRATLFGYCCYLTKHHPAGHTLQAADLPRKGLVYLKKFINQQPRRGFYTYAPHSFGLYTLFDDGEKLNIFFIFLYLIINPYILGGRFI